ncbi:hypothetical protein ABVT39_001296 [Epinephelus coioides]
MVDGVSRGSAASGFNHQPRLKPTIYKTVDDQVIVEDEFLNFLVVKIKMMTQDELVPLASNTFDCEWIESSKKVLFELCPDTKQRCVTFKGNQRDVNNTKCCLKVLNECGDNIPWFVSHHLDELLPVMFNNLDVSNLLSKMERLHSEVCVIRHAMKLQADISEDLHTVAATIDGRVAAVERRFELGCNGGPAVPSDAEPAGGRALRNNPAREDGAASVKDACVPGSTATGDFTCVDLIAAPGTVEDGVSPG